MDTGQSASCAPMQSSGATDRPDQQDPPGPGALCKVDNFARVVDDKALRSGESRCNAKEDRRTQRRNITTIHVGSTRQGRVVAVVAVLRRDKVEILRNEPADERSSLEAQAAKCKLISTTCIARR
jgi:hypothetical protein